MAEPTYAELLAVYKSALLTISTGQAYTMPGGRSLTRASLSEVRETIAWLQNEIAREEQAESEDDETGTGIVLARFN
ncbi:MAG TPA: DUF6148 family protein [Tepidisphaeraceae bacterium]|jgi:hypothetical protein|nr:DUF6148 family protein [Tepidisphaeraceae bacterium]